MKISAKLISLLLIQFYAGFICTGQNIWPGDVNDNGIVNGIDALYVGISHGTTGPIRPGATANWEAQMQGVAWPENFNDGTNYAFSDCDGNGTIEEADFEVIENNFFLTHGTLSPDEYSGDNGGDAPRIQLLPQNGNIGVGGTIVFDLWIGDDDFPVQDFYGIALSLSYNPDFTLGSQWEFEDAVNAWFDPLDVASEDVYAVDEGNGKMELALTRTDQQNVSGSGKVGEFSIVIEDIIFGLAADTLHLEIEAVRMIDKDFNTLTVVADSAFVVISRPNATSGPLVNNNEIEVYPNPARDAFTVAADSPILTWEIWDYFGGKIYESERQIPGSTSLHIPIAYYRLPPRLYLLKVQTEKGIAVEKILLQ